MTSPRGSNGGGEARWSGLVALADLGSRVLSAPAALPACYTAALRRLTPQRRFEVRNERPAGSWTVRLPVVDGRVVALDLRGGIRAGQAARDPDDAVERGRAGLLASRRCVSDGPPLTAQKRRGS